MEGTVKRPIPEKSYAWITGENNEDFFLHGSECTNFGIGEVRQGDRVAFEPTYPEKGPRATKATKL